MKATKILLALVLVDFVGLTAYAVYQHGYLGFFELMMANAATLTAMVDLCIALALIMAWMWKDARRRGVSVVPYVLLTLGLGSVGPLLYLIRRPNEEEERATRPLHARAA
jgi:fatty acid desaturase